MEYMETPAQIVFRPVDHLKVTGTKVVYQGVPGAYTQQAMLEFFGDCDSFHVDTWKDALEAVTTGKADYAVLPIENSSAGIVSENYDNLLDYDVSIVGEQIIAVNHCLMALPGAKMEDIRYVYSHPQALMQCSEYLNASDWEAFSYKNTAMAAKKVHDNGKIDQAAISSRITAQLYGLQILEEGIQNNKKNATRFLIVSNRKVYRKDAKHISVCLQAPNESGALYRILSHFYFMNLNMINIQSRPIPDQPFTYRFFIDFEGNFEQPAVRKALRRLEEDTKQLRILGTY